MTSLLPLALAASLVAPGAAPPPSLEAQADSLFRPLVKDKKGVGVVVGVLTPGGRRVFGYGGVAANGGKPPDGRTLFEIGSITKPFTAVVLAELAREGKLKLDDPLQLHLPPGLKVPRRGDKQITLAQLATHTSGLPRVPASWLGLVFHRRPDNPYTVWDVKHLTKFLGGHELRRDPGAAYEYSNLGAGLLGLALAQRDGVKSYEELVVRRVCGPLGLDDTRITLSPDQLRRFAQGHGTWGRPVKAWDFDALAGCGALRSGADDLLRFAAANLGLTRTPLRPALEECHKPRVDAWKPVRVGLAWHLIPRPGREGAVVFHDGQTGGFHCLLAFVKESGTAVAVLCNSTQIGGLDVAGFSVLKVLNARAGSGKRGAP
jgi:CubicO group peptidase (beta-lactamase class C family)